VRREGGRREPDVDGQFRNRKLERTSKNREVENKEEESKEELWVKRGSEQGQRRMLSPASIQRE
jgi:hypothetical protein